MKLPEKTIQDGQSQIASALESLRASFGQLPDGLKATLKPLLTLVVPVPERAGIKVSLRSADNRQIKRSARLQRWVDDPGIVCISYDAPQAEEAAEDATTDGLAGSVAEGIQRFPRYSEEAVDLIRALAKAERDPQFGFVALKWFRDTYLPHQGFQWAEVPENRHLALKKAIEMNWILTAKVANPRNPEFPVTTIKTNRHLPVVIKLLEQSDGAAFVPITIPGGPLSETVLSGRR
jgi:hypothetical protein